MSLATEIDPIFARTNKKIIAVQGLNPMLRNYYLKSVNSNFSPERSMYRFRPLRLGQCWQDL